MWKLLVAHALCYQTDTWLPCGACTGPIACNTLHSYCWLLRCSLQILFCFCHRLFLCLFRVYTGAYSCSEQLFILLNSVKGKLEVLSLSYWGVLIRNTEWFLRFLVFFFLRHFSYCLAVILFSNSWLRPSEIAR